MHGPALALGVPEVGPRGIREESRDIDTLNVAEAFIWIDLNTLS